MIIIDDSGKGPRFGSNESFVLMFAKFHVFQIGYGGMHGRLLAKYEIYFMIIMELDWRHLRFEQWGVPLPRSPLYEIFIISALD